MRFLADASRGRLSIFASFFLSVSFEGSQNACWYSENALFQIGCRGSRVPILIGGRKLLGSERTQPEDRKTYQTPLSSIPKAAKLLNTRQSSSNCEPSPPLSWIANKILPVHCANACNPNHPFSFANWINGADPGFLAGHNNG